MAEHEELAGALGVGARWAVTPTGSSRCSRPGPIVWHNHDRKEVDAVENMATIAMLSQLVDGLKSETRYLAPTADGFVFQFVVRGTVNSNGNAVRDAQLHRRHRPPTAGTPASTSTSTRP